MADSGMQDLDADLTLFGRSDLDIFDDEGLAGSPADGGFACNDLACGTHCSWLVVEGRLRRLVEVTSLVSWKAVGLLSLDLSLCPCHSKTYTTSGWVVDSINSHLIPLIQWACQAVATAKPWY